MLRRMSHLVIVTTAPERKRISSNGWPPADPLARTPAPSLPGSNRSSPPLNNRRPWFAPSVRAFGPNGVSQSIRSLDHLLPPGAFAGTCEPAAGQTAKAVSLRGDCVDAESAAELGDGMSAIFLAPDLTAPPFAPRLATCRRSESEHDRSPGDEK